MYILGISTGAYSGIDPLDGWITDDATSKLQYPIKLEGETLKINSRIEANTYHKGLLRVTSITITDQECLWRFPSID